MLESEISLHFPHRQFIFLMKWFYGAKPKPGHLVFMMASRICLFVSQHQLLLKQNNQIFSPQKVFLLCKNLMFFIEAKAKES